MICPKCGFAAYPNDEFCRNCGSALPDEPIKKPVHRNVPNYVNVPREDRKELPWQSGSISETPYAAAAADNSVSPVGTRFLRVLAFVLDGAFCLFVLLFTAVFAAVFLQLSDEATEGMISIMLLVMLGSFWLRDVVLCGRSIGKRICRLCVCDKESGKRAGRGRCLLRTLGLLVIHIDGILMLFTGLSIGDRIARTVVLPMSDVKK